MNTEERIKEIINEVNVPTVNTEIVKLMLEALVIQAQLEQLQKEK